jgi:phosphopantothenoylcysteine decarboxylase / phosphopantothenate---cysteine ligase
VARLLVGVSGGIAAYKALELIRLATRAGHSVRAIQTPTSERFVGVASFEGITGAPVMTSEFARDPMRGAYPGDPLPEHEPISHLQLVASADAYVIAPASANTIAKLAHGLADNLVTTAALAAACPVLVAPAMNDQMWANPATRANLDVLRARGITVLDPGTGALGSKGEWGTGRLREPADLLAAVEAVVPSGAPRPLDGLRVLVTAGGTREPIDSVRYIGNRSSGRMGFALADEAARRGAAVTCVAANVALDRNPVVSYVDVEIAAELAAACQERFADCDLLLMAAAVADYRPPDVAGTKLKKDAERLELALERTEDVLSSLARRRRPDQTLVGFAAEHGEGDEVLQAARGKLERKGLDAVVLNDISRDDIGFDAADNEVTIVTASGEVHVPQAGKGEVAGAILDAVQDILNPEEYNRRDGAARAARSRRPG